MQLINMIFMIFFFFSLQRGSDELLSQAAVMAPASDNNNQDLVSKKAKLDSNTVLGGVGKFYFHPTFLILFINRPFYFLIFKHPSKLLLNAGKTCHGISKV